LSVFICKYKDRHKSVASIKRSSFFAFSSMTMKKMF
jgi:hypothetical protein